VYMYVCSIGAYRVTGNVVIFRGRSVKQRIFDEALGVSVHLLLVETIIQHCRWVLAVTHGDGGCVVTRGG
jgi:hypothetical protein